MNTGFIRDPLEIKFLILYIEARISEPIPVETVQELTMCDDGIDYFTFSECLADLVNTGHLTLNEDGCYEITAKGMKNSKICETRLPLSVRMRSDANIEECNQKLKRKKQIYGTILERENGTFTVELSMDDDVDNIMKLNLMVASRNIAEELVKKFKNDPEAVYSKVLAALYE